MSSNPSDSLDLLAFGAHPDDVELSCGGLIALSTTRGHRVCIVDLTRGERATNGTVEGRHGEAQAAAQVLGATRETLDLPDGGLDPQSESQLGAVVAVLRRLTPRLVLAPWREARHPDHAAASALIERACFLAGLRRFRPDLGLPKRPDRLIFYPERIEAKPSFVVDTSAVQAQKAAALACHASQFGGTQPTLLTQPLGLAAFEVRDRYWGATIGTTHGEPYVLPATLPIADPIAHFQAHPQAPVLWPTP